MEVSNFFPVYIVLVTVFLPASAQTTGLNIPTDSSGISEKNGIDVSSSENNRRNQNLINLSLNSKGQHNEISSTSKRKSPQVPLNFVIDAKPRTIPLKIPLVIKTGNVKPAPAHYKRIKENTRRRNSKSKSEMDSSSNKKNQSKKATRQEMVKSIATHKSSNRHKSSKFFEDETDMNDKFLVVQSKSSKPKKPKKHQDFGNRHDNPVEIKLENDAYTEIRRGKYENETGCDCNKSNNIENGTDSTLIATLIPSIQFKTESNKGNENLDKKLEDYITAKTPITLTVSESEILSTPTSEHTTAAEVVNDHNTQNAVNMSDNKKIEPALREYTILTVDPEKESPVVITIKDQNYQEIEEKGPLAAYPEHINEGVYSSEPRETGPLNPVSTNSNPFNTYDTYIQDYQTEYNQDLKYTAENTPAIYNEDNFNPYGNIPETAYTNTSDGQQLFSSPIQQLVQDIYVPLQTNTINIRPENSVGRIWRIWKDTNIKIIKPKYAITRPYYLGRNYNEINCGKLIAKTPALEGCQTISLDRYYDNLKNI